MVSPYEGFVKDLTRGNKNLFESFEDLCGGILESWGNMLAQMVAQLMAKATLFGVLNLLSGGGFGFAGGLLDSFSWFANGTDYAYGGMATVGERGPEQVYLPKGSRVVSSDETKSKSITINNNMVVSQIERPETIYKKQDQWTKRMVALGIV